MNRRYIRLLCLALSLTLLCGCGAAGESGAEETEPTESAVSAEAPEQNTTAEEAPAETGTEGSDMKEESSGMKPYEVVFARGLWMTQEPWYDGISQLSQESLSTQKFNAETLPAGSVIEWDESLDCDLFLWENGETVSAQKPDGNSLVIDADFWTKAESCAFNLLPGGETENSALKELFTVSVPADSRDRREYTWNDDGCLKLLTVGNSFSDDAMEYVWRIARSAGIEEIKLGNLFYGGCTIEQHYSFWTGDQPVYEYRENSDGWWVTHQSATYMEAFRNTDWDYICFQQSASQAKQTDEAGYEHLADLISMAKELCPEAHIVYHMPWANPHEYYGYDTETMYRHSMTALRRIVEEYPEIEEIMCTGTAIQNVRTSYLTDMDLIRDGWHLSYDLGRYTAGLALFAKLTGISVENIAYAPKGLTETEKAAAIEAAMNAAENPRLVTPSVYTSAPENEEKPSDGMDEKGEHVKMKSVPGNGITVDGKLDAAYGDPLKTLEENGITADVYGVKDKEYFYLFAEVSGAEWGEQPTTTLRVLAGEYAERGLGAFEWQGSWYERASRYCISMKKGAELSSAWDQAGIGVMPDMVAGEDFTVEHDPENGVLRYELRYPLSTVSFAQSSDKFVLSLRFDLPKGMGISWYNAAEDKSMMAWEGFHEGEHYIGAVVEVN